MKKLFLFITLLLASAAHAQDYRFIFQATNNGTAVYTRTTFAKVNCDGTTLTCSASGGALNLAAASPMTSLSVTSLTVGPGIANDGTTGTTNKLLAKLVGTTLIKAATTDTAIPVYPVVSQTTGCTSACTTGNAYIATSGTAPCTFDNAVTAEHWVQVSTVTAGNCRDTGSATAPTSGWVVGRVHSTGAAGDYLVELVQGYNATASGTGTAILAMWYSDSGTGLAGSTTNTMGLGTIGWTSNDWHGAFTVSHNCTVSAGAWTLSTTAQPAGGTLTVVIKAYTPSTGAVGAQVGTFQVQWAASAPVGTAGTITGTTNLVKGSYYVLSGTNASGSSSGTLNAPSFDCQ